jgi:hypothetical protein
MLAPFGSPIEWFHAASSVVNVKQKSFKKVYRAGDAEFG